MAEPRLPMRCARWLAGVMLGISCSGAAARVAAAQASRDAAASCAGRITRIPLPLAHGARAVVRLEDRWTVAHPRGRAALGVAGFVDAGKVWAGDAPFGVTDRVRTAVGVGLLAAVPVESKRLWRVDVALPVNPDARARRPEARFTTTFVHGFWREPRDIARARAGAAPSTIFTWP